MRFEVLLNKIFTKTIFTFFVFLSLISVNLGAQELSKIGIDDGISSQSVQFFEELPLPRCSCQQTNGQENDKENSKNEIDHEIHEYAGFTLCYRESYEIAEWVCYEITVDELVKEASRSNNFRADKKISTGSASPDDYRSSGYDRGHLAPAADMAWSKEAMSESFLMSNMTPQDPSFNRGIWNKLEGAVRDWVESLGSCYVVTGPILDKPEYPVIGANGVAIPEYFYKVLFFVDDDNVAMIGFIIPNEGSSANIMDFSVPVDEVEKRTGLDFFWELEDNLEESLESDVSKSYSLLK